MPRTYKPTGRPRGRPRKIPPSNLGEGAIGVGVESLRESSGVIPDSRKTDPQPGSQPGSQTDRPLTVNPPPDRNMGKIHPAQKNTPPTIVQDASKPIAPCPNNPAIRQPDKPTPSPTANSENLPAGDQGESRESATVEMLSDCLASGRARVQSVLQVIMPSETTRARSQLAEAVTMTVGGEHWLDVAAAVALSWQFVSRMMSVYPLFARLFRAAQDSGDEIRVMVRDREIHRRAVEGWDEPAWYRGVQCGVVRRYSDRLLETLHIEDHPELHPVAGAGVQVNVQVQALLASLEGSDVSSLIGKDIK